ncbi:hypothetical protein MASR2M15_12600 [Anaerolineales bacterium]
MKYILVVLLLSVLAAITFAFGFDDKGQLNDPSTNLDANACFEGGSLAGRCTTDWDWICGWYLIRFEEGLIRPDQVPDYCQSLLLGSTGQTSGLPGGGPGSIPTSGATSFPTSTSLPLGVTSTATPTNTSVGPTSTPSNTPTFTMVPPTSTPSDTPTFTMLPPTSTPSNTPTFTMVPPTSTPTFTPTYTATIVPSHTPI